MVETGVDKMDATAVTGQGEGLNVQPLKHPTAGGKLLSRKGILILWFSFGGLLLFFFSHRFPPETSGDPANDVGDRAGVPAHRHCGRRVFLQGAVPLLWFVFQVVFLPTQNEST